MAVKEPGGYKRKFSYKYSHFGKNIYGHDLKAFGDSTGKYIHWDASADTFYIKGTLDLDGTFNSGNIALIDNETLTFGTGLDVVIKWDGTNLILSSAADDSLIEIGDSAATQLSFDIKWYGDNANGASFMYFDASANLIYSTNIDMRFNSYDYLKFGTTDQVTIRWDADSSSFVFSAATDDTLIEIGDSAATQKSFDIKWYGQGASGIDYLYADASRNLIELTGIELNQRKRMEIFDDFFYQTLTEANTPWILNSGGDAQAVDPAVDNQENGVIILTSGDADGTVANDGSQMVCSIPVQADSGGLVFEARLHINTAITEISVNAGFTDSTSLEEPFTGASDTLTSVCSDGACFVFDDGNTTKEWFAAAVDGDTDDTGNAATGSAPVADTYQTLRIEVSANGGIIYFYVDGVVVTTLSGAAGVSPDVNLYATVVICSTTTTSKSVDIDYIYVGHNK